MPSHTRPAISFTRGTFSIFVAPSSLLSEALNDYLIRQHGSILLLSGTVPGIVSRIRTNKNPWNIQTITRAHQMLTTLENACEPLILIEHDRSLYDEDADLIRPIARICRRKVSEKGTVFMFGSRPDGWLNNFEPFAHKMVRYEEDTYDLPGTKTTLKIPPGQMRLPGL